MYALKKLFDRVLAAACVALFAVLVVVVVWQVFTRQVLQDPSAWSSELSQYLFVWLGLFGAALVFAERGHIAVDFVVRKFSAGAQRFVGVLVEVVVAVFALAVLVWGGWRLVLQTWTQNLSGLPLQLGPMYLVLPITGLLITFYAIYHIVHVLRGDEPSIETTDDSEAI
jgi:TRAP-type C4-dicarboxylate transport system permease small subunit